MKGVTLSFEIHATPENNNDVELFLSDSLPIVIKANQNILRELGSAKVWNKLVVEMKKITSEGVTRIRVYLSSNKYVIHNKVGLVTKLLLANKKIVEVLDKYLQNGSGWTLNRIESLYINSIRFDPLSGSSYCKLPKHIENSQGIINVVNKDDKCFAYSILAGLHPVKEHQTRVNNYIPLMNKYNWDGINFPASEYDIEKFESQNEVSINVLLYDKSIKPFYVTEKVKDKHVNLLLYYDEELELLHYVTIKNMEKLMHNQKSHHDKHYYCFSCLSSFTNKIKYDEHMKNKCQILTKVIMPTKD